MLVLHANQEQRQVFNDLIQEINKQVVWSGRFILMGDRLILEGFVRSLCFHYDIRQAEVKLFDLPVEDEEGLDVRNYKGLEDLIAMTVFVFHKWGILTGVDAQEDVAELERLFGEILGTYRIDLVFTAEKLEFYQAGIRITYEDVADAMIAYEKKANPQIAVKDSVLRLPAVRPEGSGAEEDGKKAKAETETAAPDPERDSQAVAQRIEKYHARIGVLSRLSLWQKKSLLRDIRNDRLLNAQEKEQLCLPVQEHECREKMRQIEEELKVTAHATYAHVQTMIRKIEKEELFEKTKQTALEKLQECRIQYGMQEVREIMEQAPPHMEREEYKELMEKLAPYEALDLEEYKQPLDKMRETLEIKEISNMLMQSPKKCRGDYIQLLKCIEEQNFARENAAPYVDQILNRIAEFDKARLKKLLSNVNAMDFETAASLYEMIAQESFLPKLRAGAHIVVSRRLEEISLRECGNFVKMLKNNMDPVLRENPRHYFYPVEQMLKKAGCPEDKKKIENALASFVRKKGMFEHPIFMADTSKEGNGRDGLLLTMEHIFYSTRLSSYRIKFAEISSVYVYTGLLNHKSLIVEEADGTKHKVPYAVNTDHLQDWAKTLDWFIRQIREYPVCEKLTYDTLEQQTRTGCRRCGCVYDGAGSCPECGLKSGTAS